jgi:hypothetical protein
MPKDSSNPYTSIWSTPFLISAFSRYGYMRRGKNKNINARVKLNMWICGEYRLFCFNNTFLYKILPNCI